MLRLAVRLLHSDQVDPDQARRSADSGTAPIDAEHHAVLAQVLAEGPTEEVLLDLTPG